MRKILAAAAAAAALTAGSVVASSVQAQPIYGADPYLQPAQVGLQPDRKEQNHHPQLR